MPVIPCNPAITAISGGTTFATGPGVSFANSNGVTFGVSGNTITASVAAAGATGIALSAGTQLATSGTVSFANSNGMTFGMAGSSVVTASFAAIKSISAGTTNATGPGISFDNGSGVSFGVNGNTVTASVAPETPFAISAGTQSVSTGTLVFSNSNGITFGMSNSSVVTASVSDFTFSLLSPFFNVASTNIDPGNGSLHVMPITSPNVVFSYWGIPYNFLGASDSTATMGLTFRFGLYTQNVSTLSLLHSTIFSGTIDHSGSINDNINKGIRIATVPWTSTITRGHYWAAVQYQSATTSQNVSFSMWIVPTPASVFSGLFGQASTINGQLQLGEGQYSATTNNLPASIAFTDIRGTQVAARRPPCWTLGSSI